MELNIKLNAEELKAAIESEALMALIERCSYGGPGNRMEATTTPATVNPETPIVTISQEPVTPAPAVPVGPLPNAPLIEEEPAITQGATAAAAVPTSAPTYSADDLASAAVALMEKAPERQQEMVELIHGYGVQAIPQIPEEKRGEFAMKLRELGAEL